MVKSSLFALIAALTASFTGADEQVTCFATFEGGNDFDPIDNDGWSVVNLSSQYGWTYGNYGGTRAANMGNFGSPAGGITGGEAALDFLISPEYLVDAESLRKTYVTFKYYENFGDSLEMPLRLWVTSAYTGDVETTEWLDITPIGLDGSTSDAYTDAQSLLFDPALNASGDQSVPIRLAFRFESSGNSGGATKNVGVDAVCLGMVTGELAASLTTSQSGGSVTLRSSVSGGTPPYTYAWSDGSTAANVDLDYAETGNYDVSLTVTDAFGDSFTAEENIEVTTFVVPTKPDDSIRVTSFNVAFSDNIPGEDSVSQAMKTSDSIPAKNIAEIIQRIQPDIILLNEFDQVWKSNEEFDLEASETSLKNFVTNYLETPQQDGLEGITYPHVYVAPCNTGVQSGFDYNNNGVSDGSDPNDAFGFGQFPGRYAMGFLSKFPIAQDKVRTFQKFLWKDMPDAYLPPDPQDTSGDGMNSYYNATELEIFRLSSKSHWDIPVEIADGQFLHCLGSHPTPPVFDDGTATEYPSTEFADWNGYRNHDEIRFWADYINPDANSYIYDDSEFMSAGNSKPDSPTGGLPDGTLFVILGDQNADPIDGDSTLNPIELLLDNSRVNVTITPKSDGGLEQVPEDRTDRDTKTASFNLRADYALPSIGMEVLNGFVFWPTRNNLEFSLLSSSDHRAVTLDLKMVAEEGEATDGGDGGDGGDGTSDGPTLKFKAGLGLVVTLACLIWA